MVCLGSLINHLEYLIVSKVSHYNKCLSVSVLCPGMPYVLLIIVVLL